MGARRARDDEVARWREHGWVLLEGLVPVEEIDAAVDDLYLLFPRAEEYHADPEGETERRLGRPAPVDEFPWPPDGPGFRHDQHRWMGEFPFPGTGALNRLVVHPSIVDFAARALDSTDLRLYQAQVSAKYHGHHQLRAAHAHRPEPLVAARRGRRRRGGTSKGSSTSPTSDPTTAPTHLVSVLDSARRRTTAPLVMPDRDRELYARRARRHRACGARTWPTGPTSFTGPSTSPSPAEPGSCSTPATRSPARTGSGYHTMQSRATSPHWVAFVEGSTPAELALFGFPPPGHPIWSEPLLDATQRLYPRLDLAPWRSALGA